MTKELTGSLPTVEFVKSKIEYSCQIALENHVIDDWFLDNHLNIVVEQCGKICQQHPEADREIVLLGAWTHDSSRLSGSTSTHHLDSAIIARQMLSTVDYPEEKIKQVEHICRSHQCEPDEELPKTIEAKIVASADAASHFIFPSFYKLVYQYHRNKGVDEATAKAKILKKLNRDYQQKIFFPEIKELLSDRYQSLILDWS